MQRLSFLLLVCASILVVSGCATKKFVRNQVKTSSDTLTARIETNEGQIKEVQDDADKKVAGVDTKVSALDTRTSDQFNTSDQKSVQFKLNSATLDPQYTDMLDEIANTLMQNPDAIVVLEGRTDSTGAKDYNVKLGERRIEAVRRYLAVEKGVPVYRIHDISFGAEKPIAENTTRDGREKNRAVMMTVMVPKTEGAVASRN